MKIKILKLICILICFQFISCNKKIDTKSFYLNKQYQKEQNIEFVAIDSKDSHLWNIVQDKENNQIITKRYNSKKELIDETTEQITENGSSLISYTLIKYDDTGEFKVPHLIKLYPEKKDLIKWDLENLSTYSGEFIYKDVIYQLNRTRRFLKEENNQLIFHDTFHVESLSEVKDIHTEWLKEKLDFSQFSYYEKHKGLVKYSRIAYDGTEKIFEARNNNFIKVN
ncbi:hypothetical protein [Aureivirga sp. CE67]|uniref:hypothetical protein n=1 Tax=Aureivirga sp. CE67 TaxID=1788983 RepID=UPI0018CBBBCA|nr:hypothetical protein [Aureivirga sp. CE67]